MTPSSPSSKDLLARSLVELRSLRQQLADAQRAKREPVAVVGIGCRFPPALDAPDALWRFLQDGGDATGDPPAGRLPGAAALAHAGMYVRRGGWLRDVEGFDARFFGITERELRSLDPQHRLLLQVSWEALEHAAIAPDRLRRSRTGVFVGISTSEYAHALAEHTPLEEIDGYFGPGTALSFAPGRLAYFLGLQGPSLAVDTACSSSLVAVHLACQSLRSGESDLALAGGVSLILGAAGQLVLCKARVLSPDGRCKTFDAGADGYARGEGCGVVVLKRLSDALSDGDRVLAVIRGSAVNQDGPSSGMTVPNASAQEAVVREALAAAGVAPHEVAYVEAHGTGTPLGDPIEVRALAAALGPGRAPDRRLLLGTVKTNLGHLEAAAGIAGLIKLALALHHGEIPRHLHFRRPNPAVAWADLPLEVVAARRPWPEGPRIAGVSSFGASGTNAHLVLEAAPTVGTPATTPPAAPRAELLVLSAQSDAALRALAGRYAQHLAEHPEVSVADVCFTAATGRARFPYALAVVADAPEQLREALATAADGATDRALARGQRGREAPRVAFVFSGQGAQRPGAGRALFATEPVFREAIEVCDALLRPHLGRALPDVLFRDDDAAHLLDQTAWAQPALFALAWALTSLWRAWGVEPGAVLGHSLGEYVAACVAGVLRLEDALPLVARRAQLMQALAPGAMAAVAAPEARVAAWLAAQPEERAGRVAVAAVNGPEETVVSGATDAVAALTEALAADGVRCKALRVARAFHSPLMDPALDAFEREAARVALAAPTRTLVSNETGRVAGDEVLRPGYLRRHMRAPVRFADGLATLRSLGYDVFVEVGPGAALSAAGARATPGALWLPSLRGQRPERAGLLEGLGALAVRGVDVTWTGLHAGAARRRVDLPTYPFQLQKYSLPSGPGRVARATPAHALVGRRLSPAEGDGAVFEADLRAADLPVLRDHRVYGQIVVSGTVHAAMVLRALRITTGEDRRYAVEEMAFLAPLVLPEEGGVRVRTRVVPDAEGARFELTSPRDDGDETPYTRGRLRAMGPGDAPPPPRDLAAVRARCGEELDGERFYERFWRPDEHALGPSFRTIAHIHRRDGEALARLKPPAIDLAGRGGLGPDDLLGVCLGEVYGQVLMPAVPDFARVIDALGYTFLGSGMARSLDHAGAPGRAAWAHAVLTGFDGEEVSGDIALLDADGAVLVAMEGLRARRVPRALLQHAVARGSAPRARSAQTREGLLAGPPEALGERVGAYLREQVAAIVGGAPDFDVHASLVALGVDSLMALDLHDALRRDLGVSLPLDATLQVESLAGLAARVAACLPPPSSGDVSRDAGDAGGARPGPPRNRWVRPLGDAPSSPRARVICFPHGGAGPTAFQPWRGRLAPDVAALSVQLPGRWERLQEPAIERLDLLLEPLLDGLAPHLVEPFVFFGVSMGALVAFELTRALRRAGRRLPAHLVVAAYPAPDLPNPLLARRDVLLAALRGGGTEAATMLQRLGLLPDALLDPDTLRLLLPALRADFEVVMSYAWREEAPLPVPITALGGAVDPDVGRALLAPWLRHTDRDFALRIIPGGGHLFYRTHPEPTLRALEEALAPRSPA